MAENPRHVLLLTGRVGTHQDVGPIRAFLDRLRREGVEAQVVCVSAEEGGVPDERLFVAPGLGRSWQKSLAVRRLGIGATIRRPDVLHVGQLSVAAVGLAIAEHWGLPYLLTVDEFPGPRDRLRLSRRWCRRLTAASPELADELVRGLGAPEAFVSVILPGIALPPEDASGRAPRSGRVPVIGTAGPLVPASGFATFLGAARRVIDAGVDAEFVIAGLGEDEVDLRRRADRLRIADRVTFAGHPVVGLRFWNVLDVYCQTSLTPTVGRALAMAMGAGVPSIATDVDGLRAVVTHEETGLCVPPNDSAALARTILAILGDPDRAARLAEQGRAFIGRVFNPDDEARNLAALYDSVLDTDNARREPAVPITSERV
jgi:glycosyltransferase involved in cell wall biosynthesis